MKRPEIKIDKEAVRFITDDEQVNLFWSELFSGKLSKFRGSFRSFPDAVMGELHRLYHECVKHDIGPDTECKEERGEIRAIEDTLELLTLLECGMKVVGNDLKETPNTVWGESENAMSDWLAEARMYFNTVAEEEEELSLRVKKDTPVSISLLLQGMEYMQGFLKQGSLGSEPHMLAVEADNWIKTVRAYCDLELDKQNEESED